MIVTDEEIWKPVVGWEGLYSVSSCGRVRRDTASSRAPAGRMMKGAPDSWGYVQVHFCDGPRRGPLTFVHRLVMEAFVGPMPRGLEINHIDRNKLNNRRDNLEYVTCKENVRHSFRTGRAVARGERQHCAILTEAQVVEIRAMKKRGLSRREITEAVGTVAMGTIDGICYGKSWKHVPM